LDLHTSLNEPHRILDPKISVWLLLLALALPISIAASSLLYFPLLSLYILGAYWTFRLWPPYFGRLEKLFLIFWGVSVISALLGVSPMHSTTRLGKDLYYLMIVLVCALITTPEQAQRLLKYFVWGGLVTAAFAILQFTLGINQYESHEGAFIYLPTVLAHWPRRILNLISMINGRATGLRSHPITFAEGLLFPIAYALSYLSEGSRQSWWKWALVLGGLLLALLFSQSRGPWIAFGMMVVALVLLDPSPQVLRRVGLVILFPAILLLCVPALRNRAMTITNVGYFSNAERLIMWRVGEQMFKDHPVWGIGPGNVVLVSPQYQTPEQNHDYGPWGHLHNTYINMAAERGSVGLLAFLTLITSIGWTISDAYRRDREAGGALSVIFLTALLSLVGWLFSGLTEATYNDSTISMMFYFVMGLALACAKDYCKT
jgi:hypothetical protein